jgi:hypothetical protein
MLTADQIKQILAVSFQKSNHAVFVEFRTVTGYAAVPSYIDVLAVGLYVKNRGIKAFEVKVSRADFISDIKQFEYKHGHALDISTEFYYVCPWNMIEKGEVPEKAGLIFIDSANQIKTIKRATLRIKDDIPMIYFQAFAMQFGNKIEIKWDTRFLGRDITDEDLEQEIKRRLGQKSVYEEQKLRERIEGEIKEKESAAQDIIHKMKIAGYLYAEELSPSLAGKLIALCHEGRKARAVVSRLKSIQEEISEFIKTLEAEK